MSGYFKRLVSRCCRAVEQRHEQQEGYCERERRLRQGEEDAANLDRERQECRQRVYQVSAYPLAQQQDRRHKVVQVIEQLSEPFHCQLPDDREQRPGNLCIAGAAIGFFEGGIVRLLRMGNRPMKEFPALSRGLILEDNDG